MPLAVGAEPLAGLRLRAPPGFPPPSLPGVAELLRLLRSGHRHLPWRLPDQVLEPRVPRGPLQDAGRSPGAPSSSRRAVGEAAGPPPRGCSGGRVGHADRGARGQPPGLQALAERLAGRKLRGRPTAQPDPGPPYAAPPGGGAGPHRATPRRAQPRPRRSELRDSVWSMALSSAPDGKARLRDRRLFNNANGFQLDISNQNKRRHIKKGAFPSPSLPNLSAAFAKLWKGPVGRDPARCRPHGPPPPPPGSQRGCPQPALTVPPPPHPMAFPVPEPRETRSHRSGDAGGRRARLSSPQEERGLTRMRSLVNTCGLLAVPAARTRRGQRAVRPPWPSLSISGCNRSQTNPMSDQRQRQDGV